MSDQPASLSTTRIAKSTSSQMSGKVETNPGPRIGEECNCSCGYIESLFSAVADDNTAVYDVFRAHFNKLVLAMDGPHWYQSSTLKN